MPVRRLNRKIKVVLLSLLLLTLTFVTQIPIVHTEPSEWILEERGDSYQIYYNSTNTRQKRWNSAPLWINKGGQYVPYIFTDNYISSGYYTIQNGRIGCKIFDYYSEFYSPDMSQIRLYSEMWEVQRYTNKWSDIGAQSGSPSYIFSQGETGMNITKTFNSWAGTLELHYIIREGRPLKHTVYFTSILEEETYRVKQQWAGIVGTKLENNTITGPTEFNQPTFRFLKSDGSLSVFENQYQAIECLDPVIVDIHAMGMKADFIFSNWTLTQGEILEIDPDTSTLDNPVQDGYIHLEGTIGVAGDYDEYYGLDNMRAGGHAISAPDIYEQTASIEWGISSIPDGATISDTVFEYHGKQFQRDCSIHEMLGARPTTAGKVAVWAEAKEGIAYYTTPGFPVEGTTREADLGSTADAHLQSQLASDWFAIGIHMDSVTTVAKYNHIYTEEYVSVNPTPTLYVTYAFNEAPLSPTFTFPINETQIQRGYSQNITWSFNDNDDGDYQTAYRIQVSEYSNFTSTFYDSNKTVSANQFKVVAFPESICMYYTRVKTWDSIDVGGPWSAILYLEVVNTAPLSPTFLTPANNSDFEPSVTQNVSWSFNDDQGDNQTAYQIQISASLDYNMTYYESNKTISASYYEEITLPSEINDYYLRVKTWDAENAEGAWSKDLFFEIELATTAGGWTPGDSTPTLEIDPIIIPAPPSGNVNIGIVSIVVVIGSAIFWNQLNSRSRGNAKKFKKKGSSGSRQKKDKKKAEKSGFRKKKR